MIARSVSLSFLLGCFYTSCAMCMNEPLAKFLELIEKEPQNNSIAGVEDINRLLMSNPELIHTKNLWGKNPLIMAIGKSTAWNSSKLIGVLLSHGAKIHGLQYNGLTPLMYCVTTGQSLMASRLLELKNDNGEKYIDVNEVIVYSGTTALHVAAESMRDLGNVEIVELLLSHKADVNAVNQKDETAIKIMARLKYKKPWTWHLVNFHDSGAELIQRAMGLVVEYSIQNNQYLSTDDLRTLEREEVITVKAYQAKFKEECPVHHVACVARTQE